MDSLPYTLIAGGIVFLAYLWVVFSIVYHFLRFGIGMQPKKLALVFLAGSILLFATNLLLFFLAL